MNKVRIYISLLVCAALLFTGCSKDAKTAARPQSFSNQVLISVTNYISFTAQNGSNWYFDEEAASAWIDYMSEKNNTDFTIFTENPDTSYELTASGERGGIVLLDNPLKIKSLADEGRIFPLDDYLADNEAWQSLPEDFRNTFKIDGKIYALPFSQNTVLNSGVKLNGDLAINTVWLSQLGLEIPETLEDLAAVGKAFANNDMNGDGTTGNDYLLSHFYAMQNIHILQSYGLYCDIATLAPVGYDPELGSIADPFFKEGALSALTYLVQLYHDGAIDPVSVDYDTIERIAIDTAAGKYGTVDVRNGGDLLRVGLGFAADNYERLTGKSYDPTDKEVLEWASSVFELLPPLNNQHPLTYSDSVYGYVLTSQTAMPKEVINRFVDLCYGLNPQTYLECNFGVEGSYILQSDGCCSVAGYNPVYGICVGGPELSGRPNLGGYYENSLGTGFVPFSETLGGGEDYARIFTGLNQKVFNYIDRYKASGQLVAVPNYLGPSGPTYDCTINVLVYSGTWGMMKTLIGEYKTVSDILENYQKKAQDIFSIKEILQESNEALDLPCVQTFDLPIEDSD